MNDSTDEVVTDAPPDPAIAAAALALHPPWASPRTLREAMERIIHLPRYRTEVLRTGVLALRDPRMDSIAQFLARAVLQLLRKDDTWTASDLAQIDPTRTDFHELVSCCGVARLGAGPAVTDLAARWLVLSQAPNVYVRILAFTNGDGLRGQPRVEAGLIEALKLGPPWARRHAVAGLCAWLGDAENRLGQLSPMLAHSDLHIRISAAEAMLRLGDPGGAPLSALLEIARDTEAYSPGFRGDALRALAHAPQSESRTVLPLLSQAMDQEKLVAESAARAIQGLRIADGELIDAMIRRLLAPARPEPRRTMTDRSRRHTAMRESIIAALAAAAPRDRSAATALQRCLGDDEARVLLAAYDALAETGREPRVDPAHVREVFLSADAIDRWRMQRTLPAGLLRPGAD